MKKVSKRGAYKKAVKQQTMRRRAAIVETKQRVHSDVAIVNGFLPGDHTGGAVDPTQPLNWRALVADDAFTNIPLRSWTRISQGLGEDQCVGQNIFSKYLNFKMQLRFPDGKDVHVPLPGGVPGTYEVPNRMIQKPTKVYLICGWITSPLNYPLAASPSPSLPAQSDATQTALDAYITQQLKPFFDDSTDKLQFRPKSTTNIKIEKYVSLIPKQLKSIATQAQPRHESYMDPSGTAPVYEAEPFGSIPDVSRSHNWKTMRKTPLTRGQDTSFAVDSMNLYPNNSWVPFAVIYNPDYAEQAAASVLDPDKPGQFSEVQMMYYRYNDAHYFTDS